MAKTECKWANLIIEMDYLMQPFDMNKDELVRYVFQLRKQVKKLQEQVDTTQ